MAAVRSDPRELDGTACDLLVIGAGLQGAAIVREAAARGLSVVLCDGRDVGAGASAGALCLVDGGMEHEVSEQQPVRRALAERERLLRQVPHLVRPLPTILPRFAQREGLPVPGRRQVHHYHRLAGVSTLPAPRSLNVAEAVAMFPGLKEEGLDSALVWFEGVTDVTRLTLANILAACEAGGRLLTHCEVQGVTDEGVRLVDLVEGVEVTLRVAVVVNATGPGADAMRRSLRAGDTDLTRQVRSSHLVLPPRAGEVALFVPTERGHGLFMIPGGEATQVGPSERECSFESEARGPTAEDLDELHDALGKVLTSAPGRSEVWSARASWCSVLAGEHEGRAASDREAVVVAEKCPFGRLLTVVGGRPSMHRVLAERMLTREFGSGDTYPTASSALPGGEGPQDVSDPLWWRYGSRSRAVRRIARDQPELAGLLCPHRPFVAAELAYALRHEGAVTFADVVMRRLAHSLGPCLVEGCLLRAFELYLRERDATVDEDLDAAIAMMLRELALQAGELAPWREHSSLLRPSSNESPP